MMINFYYKLYSFIPKSINIGVISHIIVLIANFIIPIRSSGPLRRPPVSLVLRGEPGQIKLFVRRLCRRNGLPQGVGSVQPANRKHWSYWTARRGHRCRHDGHHGWQNVRQTKNTGGGISDAQRVSDGAADQDTHCIVRYIPQTDGQAAYRLHGGRHQIPRPGGEIYRSL